MTTRVRRRADLAYLDANLHIPKQSVNVEGTKRALSFTYVEGQGRKEKQLYLFRESKYHLQVPREFWDPAQFPFEVVDLRPQRYPKTNIRSKIKLDHHVLGNRLVPTGKTLQREAVQALLDARGGILQLGCGKGKTVIALETIARLKVPAIIIVDNTQLLLQWQEEIERFLEVPQGVGLIKAETFDWNRPIVLATYQTLAARADNFPEEARRHFGVAIWDEAHHVNAPTFSKSADLFYGRRYGLTATPQRDDGLHIIHEFHLGRVLYRDLSQDNKPKINFFWTGLSPDMSNPEVAAAVHAKNGEINIGRLASYFGRWQPRIDFVLKHIRSRLAEGRKILVLSVSVDELINLLAAWNGQKDLYTDIPVPTPADIGETLPPERLSEKALEKRKKTLEQIKVELRQAIGTRANELKVLRQRIEEDIKKHEIAVRLDKILAQRQAEYRRQLIDMPSDAGLMIHKVPSHRRMDMLKKKSVTFAIMKYGKEGLDDAALDTVICLTPMSSKAVLQQVMGRGTRHKEGKQTPVVDIIEDNVGPLIGMCRKMRQHLRNWPVDEGGPFTYELVNYPNKVRKIL